METKAWELGKSAARLMEVQRSPELPRWLLLRVPNLSACWVCVWVAGKLPVPGIHLESQNRTREVGLAEEVHD